jgi:hypothetical protein
VRGCPFSDQFYSSVWQVTFHHFKGIDTEKANILTINCVKMWWGMIAEEELDNDFIKSCNFRLFLVRLWGFDFLPRRR